jgi:hypothetical protein
MPDFKPQSCLLDKRNLQKELVMYLIKERTMPVPKKKRTTPTPDPSTSEPSSPVLPEQQVFHQYLRTLVQRAVRIVIETVMREELDAFNYSPIGNASILLHAMFVEL